MKYYEYFECNDDIDYVFDESTIQNFFETTIRLITFTIMVNALYYFRNKETSETNFITTSTIRKLNTNVTLFMSKNSVSIIPKYVLLGGVSVLSLMIILSAIAIYYFLITRTKQKNKSLNK